MSNVVAIDERQPAEERENPTFLLERTAAVLAMTAFLIEESEKLEQQLQHWPGTEWPNVDQAFDGLYPVGEALSARPYREPPFDRDLPEGYTSIMETLDAAANAARVYYFARLFIINPLGTSPEDAEPMSRAIEDWIVAIGRELVVRGAMEEPLEDTRPPAPDPSRCRYSEIGTLEWRALHRLQAVVHGEEGEWGLLGDGGGDWYDPLGQKLLSWPVDTDDFRSDEKGATEGAAAGVLTRALWITGDERYGRPHHPSREQASAAYEAITEFSLTYGRKLIEK